MFWKGDTLVYDATAFKLPDGSMLDAFGLLHQPLQHPICRQRPGPHHHLVPLPSPLRHGSPGVSLEQEPRQSLNGRRGARRYCSSLESLVLQSSFVATWSPRMPSDSAACMFLMLSSRKMHSCGCMWSACNA